ncbi:MAG: hypothetical protein EXQ87_12930 [Alphaproteobacteria bacterium]|nr:hypothetical protein [Alphaproteobacteria bacterium]
MRKPVDDTEIQAFLAKGGTIKKLPTIPPDSEVEPRPRRKKPAPAPAPGGEPATIEAIFGKPASRRERMGPTVETVFGEKKEDTGR